MVRTVSKASSPGAGWGPVLSTLRRRRPGAAGHRRGVDGQGVEVEVTQLQGPFVAVELHGARQVVPPVDLLTVVLRQQQVTGFLRRAHPVVNGHNSSSAGGTCRPEPAGPVRRLEPPVSLQVWSFVSGVVGTGRPPGGDGRSGGMRGGSSAALSQVVGDRGGGGPVE